MLVSRLLVIQLDEARTPGRLAGSARAAGCLVQLCRPFAGDELVDSLAQTDGLVVLGGAVGAYEDPVYPWLSAVKTLIALALIERVPLIAVDSGHQLAAVALGGRVSLNPRGLNRGVSRVLLTADGHSDELLSGVRDRAPIVHWNDDVVVDLPVGAVALAHDPHGWASVVRYGPAAWGFQGHPEATADQFARWAELPDHGVQRHPDAADATTVTAKVEAADAELARTWEPVLARFAALVAGHRLGQPDQT